MKMKKAVSTTSCICKPFILEIRVTVHGCFQSTICNFSTVKKGKIIGTVLDNNWLWFTGVERSFPLSISQTSFQNLAKSLTQMCVGKYNVNKLMLCPNTFYFPSFFLSFLLSLLLYFCDLLLEFNQSLEISSLMNIKNFHIISVNSGDNISLDCFCDLSFWRE